MAADLTGEPWVRLVKLAPPATEAADLQAAADRWNPTLDLYAAAADLWEEKAMSIDMTSPTIDDDNRAVKSVSQDGITVTYENASSAHSAKLGERTAYMNQARQLRRRAKPVSPLMHPTYYDAFTGRDTRDLDEEIFISVDPEDVIP